MNEPSPYCTTEPYQLRVWDQTALAGLMHCPRYHWLAQIKGYRSIGPAHDLTWGDCIHQGADVYVKALRAGATAEQATELALAHVLDISWPEGQGRDLFGGYYGEVWQCTDRTRTNARKGIKRCAWSYKEHLVEATTEHWHRPFGDMQCECGLPVASRIAYLCEEKTKNRRTLARSIITLCDKFTASTIRPAVLSDGRTGSEVRWFRELSIQSPDGTPYLMTGSFDQVAEEQGRKIIPELKTTRKDPNPAYYAQHETGAQVHTYAWAADGAFPEDHPRMMLTVIHVSTTNTEVYFRPIRISAGSLSEWERDMGFWIIFAEDLSRNARQIEEADGDPAEAFRRNITACNGMPGAPTTPCPFRDICRLDPGDRQRFLDGNFRVERWNPIACKGVS